MTAHVYRFRNTAAAVGSQKTLQVYETKGILWGYKAEW